MSRHARTVELFAGPGGWMEGARILGAELDAEGIELAKDAIATATAAGHIRREGDVFTVDPAEYPRATGLVASSPCPSFSVAGTRSGLGDDYQQVLDVWTGIGWGIDPAVALADLHVLDPRTALLAIAGVWAMTLPSLEWIAMEQVPAVEYAFVDLAAELYSVGWASVDVQVLDSADFGVPSRRRRVFLVANRTRPAHLAHRLDLDEPRRWMSRVLGWEPGHKVYTRGARIGGGGNAYSADQPSWCLTSKARAWYREDGHKLSVAEAGLLSGFPVDYPWQGSRSSMFQQTGDIVSPVMSAIVLGAALGIDPVRPVKDHLARLYGATDLTPTQGDPSSRVPALV